MGEKRTILVFETPYKLTNYLVTEWVACARQSIERRGRFMVAFSGGRTPIEFYCKLSNIDDFSLWRDVHVFLTDERFVSEDHSESTIRMIRQTMLHYIPIPSENIHPILTTAGSPAAAAAAYEEDIRRCFPDAATGIPRFDCMVLGIGSRDGHVASLFSSSPVDVAAQHLVVPTTASYVAQKRVSMTLPLINNSRQLFMLGMGKSKAEIVHQAFELGLQCPARYVYPTDGNIAYLFDRYAASRLTYVDSYAHHGDAVRISI